MKILIYRISSMGDIVLTTPVVRALKQQIPNACIHFVTRKKYADVLLNNPYIDKLWLVEHSPIEITELLKQEDFDQFIDLHRNIRSRMLAMKLGMRRHSFPKLNIRKWVYTALKINFLPSVHIVSRYFRAVRHLGVADDAKGADFFMQKSIEHVISELPEKYFVLALGGTFATKRYPVEGCSYIAANAHLPVVLIGGIDEQSDAAEIVRSSPEKVINKVGLLSITESAALIQHSVAVVSNDTGMMHIAAALQKPMVSIWGSTVPAFGMYPLYAEEYRHLSVIIETDGLRCRPCSKLGYSQCPKGHFRCMKDIDPARIVSALKRFSE